MAWLSTPYPWLDMDIVEENISRMAGQLEKAGVSHRPHIKTHKSVELARMQLAAGAKGITCAKLSEALVMAKAGIQDILVGYPLVGEDKMRRLAELMEIAKVTVTVDNLFSAAQLNNTGKRLERRIPVLAEVGAQNMRGGFFSEEKLTDFLKEIRKFCWLEVKGIFTYVGLKPNLSQPGALEKFAAEEAALMETYKSVMEKNGYPVEIVSAGSSATSCYPWLHGPITESRAGNYIFNDMNAVYLGTAEESQCALKIRATVVSTPADGLATVDAGSKSLSSDTRPGQGYGRVAGHPEIELYKLNEEHGYFKFDPAKTRLAIGQELDIIPNHACVVGNLHDQYFAFRKGKFEKVICVDARGKNY